MADRAHAAGSAGSATTVAGLIAQDRSPRGQNGRWCTDLTRPRSSTASKAWIAVNAALSIVEPPAKGVPATLARSCGIAPLDSNGSLADGR
jgi:hypothetical protein